MLKEIWIIILMYLDFGAVIAMNKCYDVSRKMGEDAGFFKLVLAVIISETAVVLYEASDKISKYYNSLETE